MKQNLYQKVGDSARRIALAGLSALSLLGCSPDSMPKETTTYRALTGRDLIGIHLESDALAAYRVAENSRDSTSIYKALADFEKARLYLEGPRWCVATYRMGKLNLWLNGEETTDKYISQLKQSDEGPACKKLALVLQQESSK